MPADKVPVNYIYSVKPWGKQYAERTAKSYRRNGGGFDGYPCAICGKDVPLENSTRYGGVVTTEGEWTLDPEHPYSQGWHPVGSACHRRYVIKGQTSTGLGHGG